MKLHFTKKAAHARIRLFGFCILLASILIIFFQQSCLASTTANNRSTTAKIVLVPAKIHLAATLNISSSKVVIEWDKVQATSHFILQRSENGVDYQDAAVIFVPEATANTINKYRYSDKINSSDKKHIYYRIKMINVNGECKYSEVISISIDISQGILA